MKIEVGKYYRTRDGRKVGPMDEEFGFFWVEGRDRLDDPEWSRDGTNRGMPGQTSADDLVAEWTETDDHPILWRDMTPEEKGALLLAQHEGSGVECHDGYEWFFADTPRWDGDTAYRVRREPEKDADDLPRTLGEMEPHEIAALAVAYERGEELEGFFQSEWVVGHMHPGYWKSEHRIRMKPREPVVTTQVIYGDGGGLWSTMQRANYTHTLTITYRDGVPDEWARIEPINKTP